MTSRRPPLRTAVKAVSSVLSSLLTAPSAFTCWLESRLSEHGNAVFEFWSHLYALLPGPPGMYLRRAHYWWTLESCAASSHIGFGTLFSRRQVRIEEGVYVGAYAVIGSAWLKEGCLIGSRASLLSGPALHEMTEDGRWTPSLPHRLQRIEIGEHTWIGEGAIVMTDVGPGAMVAAGAVVSVPVPGGVVVAGNPARFVRKLRPDGTAGAPRRAPEASDGVDISSVH